MSQSQAEQVLVVREGTFQLFRQRLPDDSCRLVRSVARRYPPSRVNELLQHEAMLLEHLAGTDVPRLLSADPLIVDQQLCFEDIAAEPLPNWLCQPADLRAKLSLAIQLMSALGRLHAANVFHLALRPEVVLYDSLRQQVCLLDFSNALHQPLRQLGSHRGYLTGGTLHYIAPEQTHQLSQPVDGRTDLYAAGCILYWLFTGQPPFAELSGSQLIHAHLVRRPTPVAQRALLPPALDSILLRLLQKDPDKRYQSAHGVVADLRHCLACLLTGQPMPMSFKPCRQDIADQLHIPRRLYGRDAPLSQLKTALNRAADGAAELLLVSGESGIGKSVLIREIQQPVITNDGLFIAGKCDQYLHSQPYSALLQALGGFLRHLLTLPNAELARWREQLQLKLGSGIAVLQELLPELRLLTGPQAPLTSLGAEESQNRFNRVLVQFLQLICDTGKPLVLFIDDLQWADQATLNLLQRLLSEPELHHCLLLGAYRDCEADPVEARLPLLQQAEPSVLPVSHIRLRALSLADLTALLADTVHQPAEQVDELAGLIFAKTAGNPFFVIQFLRTLYQELLLNFDAQRRCWYWSIDEIRCQGISDNVVRLLVHKLQQLPDSSRQLVQQGACIGPQFSLGLLSGLSGISRHAVWLRMQPALDLGLLLPVEESSPPRQLRFMHDRVRQAAYGLLSQQQQARLHLKIGYQLLQETTVEELDDHCFDIADHLNSAVSLIERREQQLQLARLNLLAARKAKETGAYQSTRDYLERGWLLLPIGRRRSGLAFELMLDRIEVRYLLGKPQQARVLANRARSYCHDWSAHTRLDLILITQLTRLGKLESAIDYGLGALRRLGEPLPQAPQQPDLERALSQVRQALRFRPFRRLVDQPETDDPRVLAALEVLVAMQPACYTAGSLLYPLTVLDQLRLIMEHGNNRYSTYALMGYALFCTRRLGDYATAREAAQQAIRMDERLPNPQLLGRYHMIYANFIMTWHKPLQSLVPMRYQAHQECLELGDHYWAIHALIFGFYADLLTSPRLARLRENCDQLIALCERIKQPAQVYLCTLQRNLVLWLQGELDSPHSLDHQAGFEAGALAHFTEHRYMSGRYERIVGRLLQSYLDGHYLQGLEIALDPELSAGDLDKGIFHEAVFTLFSCLSIVALKIRSPQYCGERYEQHLAEGEKLLKRWQSHCPDNFASANSLLQAEQYQLQGKVEPALVHYDRAIEQARQAEFPLLHALANERCGEFWQRRGNMRIAGAYLQEAVDIYRDWGARGKAALLQRRLNAQQQPAARELQIHERLGDWPSLLVTEPQALIGRLLQRVAEFSGAQRACLFCWQPAEARWLPQASLIEGQLTEDGQSHQEPVPTGLLNYVSRNRALLVLDEGSGQREFMADPYIQQQRPRSLLCLPLTGIDDSEQILYLDSQHSDRLFGEPVVQQLEVFTGQFVVAYQHSCRLQWLEQQNQCLQAQLKQQHRLISGQQQRLDLTLAALPLAFVITGYDGTLVQCNEQAMRLFQLSIDQLDNYNARDFYADTKDRARVIRLLQSNVQVQGFECLLRNSRGESFWGLFSATTITLDDKPRIFAAISDISERKQAEETQQRLVNLDLSTGVLNRESFLRRAELSRRDPSQAYLLAVLEFDQLKRINRQLGHAIGDEMLFRLCRQLETQLGPQDLLGRISSDEFALLLRGPSGEAARQRLQAMVGQLQGGLEREQRLQLNQQLRLSATDWQPDEPLMTALQRALGGFDSSAAARRGAAPTLPQTE
ncbi:AAA family ATPase [Marinobacterium arenosum]|uniref:AAA family ATPase n=1 Tax=Marinobacterium arenosum TaxID=2862496 RepID=UPI001C95F87E|nr:AAA family ATPase [Marinobacterium arenosum]MBY4676053.1 AAA family ATPase [Marinobacterium arenosum]